MKLHHVVIAVLVVLLLAAIGTAAYFAFQPDSGVAKTVATETVEDEPCVVPDKPTQKILPGTAWDFNADTCEYELVSTKPVAETADEPAVEAEEDVSEDALVAQFPTELNVLFGDGSTDLGLIIVPDTSNGHRPNMERGFQFPQYPAVVQPVDEDGMLCASAGYAGITVGPINDKNGPIYRAEIGWEENVTHWICTQDHSTDIGAHQTAWDHYAASNVSVISGFPTPQQFAQNLRIAVNHDSGINDEVDPAPVVRVHIINSETGERTMLDITYNGGDSWSFGNPVTDQLPTIEEWLASH